MATLAPAAETAAGIVPEDLPLWEPQKRAIRKMGEYIDAFHKERLKCSALVQMPTGSGKTGVIACLAHWTPGCVLILTPHADLRDQLARETGGKFFERLTPPFGIEQLPKQVARVYDIRPLQAVQHFEQTILISTIQMVHGMQTGHPLEWENLLEHVTLLMVDEGHYEPAASWSECIRKFHVPKVIFTATPFRNDLKVFDIGKEHIFTYTYQQALSDHILREVQIVPRREAPTPNVFVKDLLQFYDSQFGDAAGEKPRVIIRCDDGNKVRQIASILRSYKRNYIAIHETFTDDEEDPSERRRVPDPRQVDATFWIHQYKLQEGIDDPRFQVLALFDPLTDGRGLIQQIGRIIRNPGRDPSVKGYLLDYFGGQHMDLWLGFLNYDRILTSYGSEAFNLATGSEWLEGIFRSQQALTYMGNRFRTPLDFQQFSPYQDLAMPKMVNLRLKREKFQFKEFCTLLEQGFQEEGRVFHQYPLHRGARLYLYVQLANSPLLEKRYFMEPELGLTYVAEFENVLAYFDTAGQIPVDFGQAGLGRAVGCNQLRRLISAQKGSRLTSVALYNSHHGPNVYRSRTLNAANIQQAIAYFDDHAHVCSSATGYSQEAEEWHRRYLGFQRGRVAESGKRESLSQYEAWVEQVVRMTETQRPVLPVFDRYARLGESQENLKARHILLDLADVEDLFVTVGDQVRMMSAGEPMEIEDTSYPVSAGKFDLRANGTVIQMLVDYESESRRFMLRSADLDRLYCHRDKKGDQRGLIRYLNEEQSFSVIPEGKNLIYVLGNLYEPPFRAGSGRFNEASSEICQLLVPVSMLADVEEEKGILERVAAGAEEMEGRSFPPDHLRWPANSLFGIIDRLGEPAGLRQKFFGAPDLLLCTDMGTEPADFILADAARQRAVFIHAKASEDLHSVSAKALQEVISQAVKNLNFMEAFSDALPGNKKRWAKAWTDPQNTKIEKKTEVPMRTGRIRVDNSGGMESWERIRAILENPQAEREVWLFLGRILSKGALVKDLGKKTVPAEALQCAYLLYSAMSNIGLAGVRLRVFCHP